jgi:phosphoglycolate phosphatase-like HAD superfamily hydrolase
MFGMMARGIILDVDGTLVDSNDAHAHAWVKACQLAGFPVTFQQVRPLIGMGADKLLPTLLGIQADDPKGKQITRTRQALFLDEQLTSVRAFGDVPVLVRRLLDDNVGVAVASSAEKRELDTLLDIAGIRELIETKTSADDAQSSKPDPDVVLAALHRLRSRPDEVLMVGDTPYDAEAAHRAGVRFLAVRCGGWNDADFPEAAAVFDNPADLLARYRSLPWPSDADA